MPGESTAVTPTPGPAPSAFAKASADKQGRGHDVMHGCSFALWARGLLVALASGKTWSAYALARFGEIKGEARWTAPGMRRLRGAKETRVHRAP
jgi:hypothetical protein